jgi:hypothetical protein
MEEKSNLEEKVVSIPEDIDLEMNISELRNIVLPMQKLAAADVVLGKDGYWLGKGTKSLVKDYQDIAEETEKQRVAIVKFASLKDDNGNDVSVQGQPGMVSIDPEKAEEYNKKIMELFTMKHKVRLRGGKFKINIDTLTVATKEPDGKEVRKSVLTPDEIATLDDVTIQWLGV